MCFICECCGETTKPRESRKTYVISRDVPCTKWTSSSYNGHRELTPATRREIVREYSVCTSCKRMLDSGLSLAEVRGRVWIDIPVTPIRSVGVSQLPDWAQGAIRPNFPV